MSSPIIIQQTNPSEGEILNLARNEVATIQVENFGIDIKRTDEGIVIDIFDVNDESAESLGTVAVFDSELSEPPKD